MITSAAVQDRDAAKTLIKDWWTFWPAANSLGRRRLLGQLLAWVKACVPRAKLKTEIVRRCDSLIAQRLFSAAQTVAGRNEPLDWFYQISALVPRQYEVSQSRRGD